MTTLILVVVTIMTWFFQNHDLAVLNPAGFIAESEYKLFATAAAMTLIVAIPVFIMTFVIVWKYRADNKNADYQPNWDHNNTAEAVWWLVPLTLITILAIMTWKSSHELDPFKPLESDKQPLTVQVVALQWRWLFIYPEQHIATLNYLQIPEDRPVNFQITSDAPMNSFWIPELGGQIYAMTGMTTKLHLIADQPGTYRGVSANLSGAGFAQMDFAAEALSEADFAHWVHEAQASTNLLTPKSYDALALPSSETARATYFLPERTVYDHVMMKYTSNGHSHHTQ